MSVVVERYRPAVTAQPPVPQLWSVSIWPFFDKVQAWLRQPVGVATISNLRDECGRGGLHVDNRSARFDGAYRQRIELRQPSEAALLWLASRGDALINRVEIALDLVFDTGDQKDDAFEFLHCHLVRRWHGKRQQIKLVRGRKDKKKRKRTPHIVDEISMAQTRYDAGRAPNKIVFYRNKFSRITGELNCLHLEWHVNRLRAVRRAGIETGEDLIEFDHRSFWEKRLLLYEVDAGRLGRLLRNRRMGKKARVSEYDDRRTGNVLINSVGSMQELIDEYGSWLRIDRILRRLSNERLLPKPPWSQPACNIPGQTAHSI